MNKFKISIKKVIATLGLKLAAKEIVERAFQELKDETREYTIMRCMGAVKKYADEKPNVVGFELRNKIRAVHIQLDNKLKDN